MLMHILITIDSGAEFGYLYNGDEELDLFLEKKEENMNSTSISTINGTEVYVSDAINEYTFNLSKYIYNVEDGSYWEDISSTENDFKKIHLSTSDIDVGWNVFKIVEDDELPYRDNQYYTTMDRDVYVFVYCEKNEDGQIFYYPENIHFYESHNTYIDNFRIPSVSESTLDVLRDFDFLSSWSFYKMDDLIIVNYFGARYELTIKKELRGNMADFDETYNLTIKFDRYVPYLYIDSDAEGEIELKSDEYSFELKGGESITFIDLPKGIRFSVVEDDGDEWGAKYIVQNGYNYEKC